MDRDSHLFLTVTVLIFITHVLPSKFFKKVAPELNSSPLLSSLGGLWRLHAEGFSYNHDGSSMAFQRRVGCSRPTEMWANKTLQGRRKVGRHGEIVRKRASLLLPSSRRWISLISGFMTAFEALSQVFFLIIKNPSHWLAFMISALCANTRTSSL